MSNRKGLILVRGLLIGLVLILVACGGQENQPADSPRLSNQARLATANAESARRATLAQIPTLSPSPTPIQYDPGPYGTPNRPRPEGPETFLPEEQIGDFTRFQVRGSCLNPDGQISTYQQATTGTLQLTCRYLRTADRATAALTEISRSNLLTETPLFLKFQGESSFLLAHSGTGFVYAWTHGNWLFVARSTVGRTALDQFMQAFPY